ncbi:MAG TPA: GNAT family N-acetyltransferase [Thermomicrobiales bacterium]|nr:GNAT family N-acetyltransferase [Thermomicrobiales bacterium]
MIEIETARLRLRPMRAPDAEALLGVFADPAVMAAFAEAPFDRAQMDRWVARNLAHQDQHGYGLCAVILKAEGLLVGDCGLTRMELDGADEVELGYDFRSDYWNRGLATEAATAVRDYAFGALGLPRLVGLIRRGNEASRRVAEKVGLRHEADLTEHGVAYWLYAIARDAAPPAP